MPDKLRIDGGEFGDALPDTTESREDRFVAVVQRRVAFLTQSLDAFSVREDMLFGRELVILSRARRRFVDLAQLKINQLEPGGLFASVHSRAIEPISYRAQRSPRGTDSLDECAKLRVAVDEREVRQRIEQGLMLVLPVQFDESQGEIAKGARSCDGPVDERATAPLTRHLTPDEQPLITVVENGLDGGLRLARSNQIGRGTPTQQQPDCFDHDRLART